MPLDPMKTTEAIKEGFIRYLTTAFRLRDQKLQALFHEQVRKFSFTNGPILEATPPFKAGSFLRDLKEDGTLDEECEQFLCRVFPYLEKNHLYLHQEKAVRKILGGRNVVIASGTGSGKTECFLLPIYKQQIEEHKEGRLTPGIRALLLYPMNALVNDQLRRLREIARIMEKEIADLRITFGRYVGDTPETEKEGKDKFMLTNPGVEQVESEMLSREEMRENPPHILITNYAMLEYLLLRPKDSSFFDGEYAGNWKFLVLDEAHIYNGANGIEMGMLIRRLKDRVCDGKTDVLQCIATSATLVRDEADFAKVAEFATNLFGEEFEWVGDDEKRQDVIKGEKVETLNGEETLLFPMELYAKLDEEIRDSGDPRALEERCCNIFESQGIPKQIVTEGREKSAGDAKKMLYEILSKDSRITSLKEFLERGSASLEKCAKRVVSGGNVPSFDDKKALISLVNVSVWARPDRDSLPLLPARYHLFVRAPEGIFASLFPEPRVFLERREETEEGHPVFALASCRRCGQEYLVGDIVEGKLRHGLVETDTPKRNKYFLLWKDEAGLEEDEDEEVAVPEEIAEKGNTWKLCIKCGAISEVTPTCGCNRDGNTTRTLIEIITKEGTLNKCYLCGLKSINVVREFVFQQDAPAAVLATALFQSLKKKEIKERKILAFSDSRQDAAFFAPYLDFTYKRVLYRRLIIEALRLNRSVKDYRLETLCEDVLRLADDRDLFDAGMDEKKKKKEVWGWILQEFCALDRRNCLEGVGLLSFLVIPPKSWEPKAELSKPPWNLSKGEPEALYQILIDTFRFNKAVILPPDGPGPEDSIFARFHRDKEYKFRGEKSDPKKGIYAFISIKSRSNTRLEFLKKLYTKINGNEADDKECKKLLGKIWDDLKTNWTGKGLYQFNDARQGVLFQFDYRYWRAAQESPDVSWFICDRCGTFLRLM